MGGERHDAGGVREPGARSHRGQHSRRARGPGHDVAPYHRRHRTGGPRDKQASDSRARSAALPMFTDIANDVIWACGQLTSMLEVTLAEAGATDVF